MARRNDASPKNIRRFQALGLDRQHEPPPVGVAIRCLLRGPDHLDTSDRQDAPELSRELGVAVADHKSVSAEESVHRIGSCPGDLRLRTDAGAVTGRFTSETQRAIEYPLDNVVYSSSTIHWELGRLRPSRVRWRRVRPGHQRNLSGRQRVGNVFPSSPSSLFHHRTAAKTSRSAMATWCWPERSCAHARPDRIQASCSCTEAVQKAAGAHRSSWRIASLVRASRRWSSIREAWGNQRETGQPIDYQELAEDYMSAVRFLQQQSGVSPTRVGVYGHSQGGTISPLIASRPGAVAVVIAAAAIGTGPIYEQNFYRTRNDLVDEGLTDPDLSRAMEFYTAVALCSADRPGCRGIRAGVGEGQRGEVVFAPQPPDSGSLALEMVPGAVHNLTIQWETGQPFFWWHGAPGYTDLLTAWVRARF